jgi:acetolactate synthase-1/2/3 large subunit
MASSGTTSKNALHWRTVSRSFTGASGDHHGQRHSGRLHLPIYDALSQSTQIRHILARHEQGAGLSPRAWRAPKANRRSVWPVAAGATNLITAIADARLDSIPLVCITGQVPASMIGTDAFQEVDTYGISIPITKHNLWCATLLSCRR